LSALQYVGETGNDNRNKAQVYIWVKDGHEWRVESCRNQSCTAWILSGWLIFIRVYCCCSITAITASKLSGYVAQII
jgi:hypothetical protein